MYDSQNDVLLASPCTKPALGDASVTEMPGRAEADRALMARIVERADRAALQDIARELFRCYHKRLHLHLVFETDISRDII